MDNFILLDGWSLLVTLIIVTTLVITGLFLSISSLLIGKENKKLKAENEKFSREKNMYKHKYEVANTTNAFLRNRIAELCEDVSLRDEAIVSSLKGESNV